MQKAKNMQRYYTVKQGKNTRELKQGKKKDSLIETNFDSFTFFRPFFSEQFIFTSETYRVFLFVVKD